MKQTIVILLLINLNITSSFSQNLRSIIVETTHLNEPPTSLVPSAIQVEFKPQASGNYVANFYKQNQQKIAFKSPQVISKTKVIRFLQWYQHQKHTFTLAELGLSLSEVQHHSPKKTFAPSFPINDDFMVKIDSFYFCKKYQFLHHDIIGGYNLKVFLNINQQKIPYFTYQGSQVSTRANNLKAYFSLQPMLNLNIPQIDHLAKLFSKKSLIQYLYYYLKTVECEGYYYKEFMAKNPQRSPRENRMMSYWSLKKYLKKRNKE